MNEGLLVRLVHQRTYMCLKSLTSFLHVLGADIGFGFSHGESVDVDVEEIRC